MPGRAGAGDCSAAGVAGAGFGEYSAARDDAADVASEVALALAISENAARIKIGLARDLVTRLPETLGALSRGD
ncbi:DUF222 domain-containing protein, partial [Prauserella oleivorans]